MGRLLTVFSRVRENTLAIVAFFKHLVQPANIPVKNASFVTIAVIVPPLLGAAIVSDMVGAILYAVCVPLYFIILDGVIAAL